MRCGVAFLVLWALLLRVSSFAPSPFPSLPSQSTSRIRMGVFDGIFAKPAAAVRAPAAKQFKAAIRENAIGTSNGVTASSVQREAIKRAVNGLVKLNTVKSPATSKLSDGTWRLVYTTTMGSSAGKLGPFVGEVKQIVTSTADPPLYLNIVTLGPLQGKLSATWEVAGPRQWRVIFRDIAILLFDITLVKKDINNAVGLWTLLYIDADYRVLTARSLARDEGNLYILEKEGR
ncbi:unnamed protein product [Phaeothamnion confervicola]